MGLFQWWAKPIFIAYVVLIILNNKIIIKFDRVQDSYEEQEFWMTRLDWVGIRLNQFEMFEEHENCLSRWNFILF